MPSCKSLRDVAHKYILRHFDDLFESEGLLLLAFKEVRKEFIHRNRREHERIYEF